MCPRPPAHCRLAARLSRGAPRRWLRSGGRYRWYGFPSPAARRPETRWRPPAWLRPGRWPLGFVRDRGRRWLRSGGRYRWYRFLSPAARRPETRWRPPAWLRPGRWPLGFVRDRGRRRVPRTASPARREWARLRPDIRRE